MIWGILLLLLFSRSCQSAGIPCGVTEYEKDGRCCAMCSPGQRLDRECTESSESVCVACPAGEYQDKWNREGSCLQHRYCDGNLGFQKLSEGTAEKNVDCVCQDGRHCSSTECETCAINTLCAPGHGVTRKADRYSDTECTPCPEGSFSNITSDTEPCRDWQRCTSLQQEIRPGTASADVVCGPLPKNSSWIVIVVILIVLIISLVVFFYVRQRGRVKKVKQQPVDPPEIVHEEQLLNIHIPNLPEEDQDITMQGLPVAQEQGKDYHISQEEK